MIFSMKVLIAAGGSGGHLLPAQQLAAELQKTGEVFFAGHRLELSPFFDRKCFGFRTISSAPLRWSPGGLTVFFASAASGICQSMKLIRRFQPDVIVGFGSFHVFPILCAAVLMRRKLVLFEANCMLGKVNRLFASGAKILASQFPLNCERKNARLVPLLPWKMRTGPTDRGKALAALGLDSGRKTFLIFGGSQGASFLNRAVPALLPKWAQAIHLAGNREASLETADRYRQAGISAVVKPFESNMDLVYDAADFAICRSGASTIAELIGHSLPSLLIPFPLAADGHQRINAEFLAKKIRGATMLDENLASPERLVASIRQLTQGSGEMKKALLDLRRNCGGRASLGEQIVQLGTNK